MSLLRTHFTMVPTGSQKQPLKKKTGLIISFLWMISCGGYLQHTGKLWPPGQITTWDATEVRLLYICEPRPGGMQVALPSRGSQYDCVQPDLSPKQLWEELWNWTWKQWLGAPHELEGAGDGHCVPLDSFVYYTWYTIVDIQFPFVSPSLKNTIYFSFYLVKECSISVDDTWLPLKIENTQCVPSWELTDYGLWNPPAKYWSE